METRILMFCENKKKRPKDAHYYCLSSLLNICGQEGFNNVEGVAECCPIPAMPLCWINNQVMSHAGFFQLFLQSPRLGNMNNRIITTMKDQGRG